MTCQLCKAELAVQQGFCPHCGSLVGLGFAQPSPEQSKPPWLLFAIIAALFFAAAGSATYLWRTGVFRRLEQSVARPPRPVSRPKRIKVDHGAVLRPDQLHGKGKVYFLAIGPQLIAPEELATHYKQKFNLDVTVLPAIPIDASMPHKSERNYLADGLMRSIIDAYTKVADDNDVTLLGLTNVDLYRSDGSFVTAYRNSYGLGVISSRGYDYESSGEEETAKVRRDLVERRMLQMITKYIAVSHWGL